MFEHQRRLGKRANHGMAEWAADQGSNFRSGPWQGQLACTGLKCQQCQKGPQGPFFLAIHRHCWGL